MTDLNLVDNRATLLTVLDVLAAEERVNKEYEG